jgi:hypothetical protein
MSIMSRGQTLFTRDPSLVTLSSFLVPIPKTRYNYLTFL